MPPPLPLLCSSAAFVFLLLLPCRPLGANGRATPPAASPPSPWAPAGQPVQQAAPAVNGSVASVNGAAAVLPAAAAPPPLAVITVEGTVEGRHHLRREHIAAIVLSSVASVMIVLAALYAFLLWRRSRRALVDSKDTQSIGPSHGSALSWHIRMKIALDTARGLEYLHEHCNPPVIHRDLKSSNILLDSDFNAKISDFGLAVISGSHSKGNIKLSGTMGYVAPEYLLDGKLTEKSDVYAFGVVLLELLLGRKPVEKTAQSQCQSIVTWAMPQLTDRSKLPNIIDPMIKSTMDLKHLYQVAAVAVLCVQPEPSYRPLITDVLHSLVPLVPMELGGTLRISPESPYATQKYSPC
ncbi:putative receptor-like protein kinase [Dichanthelium oligosanthes]|uniref:Putative receptor-like protein kinase n=1 Tax=Dichanthelium oligosanthes TaxID=888268 RepID=A0A1E5VNA6_9POAL|nr:putative receptor-like protein kinase [Dichanthelium oligosanthes]